MNGNNEQQQNVVAGGNGNENGKNRKRAVSPDEEAVAPPPPPLHCHCKCSNHLEHRCHCEQMEKREQRKAALENGEVVAVNDESDDGNVSSVSTACSACSKCPREWVSHAKLKKRKMRRSRQKRRRASSSSSSSSSSSTSSSGSSKSSSSSSTSSSSSSTSSSDDDEKVAKKKESKKKVLKTEGATNKFPPADAQSSPEKDKDGGFVPKPKHTGPLSIEDARDLLTSSPQQQQMPPLIKAAGGGGFSTVSSSSSSSNSTFAAGGSGGGVDQKSFVVGGGEVPAHEKAMADLRQQGFVPVAEWLCQEFNEPNFDTLLNRKFDAINARVRGVVVRASHQSLKSFSADGLSTQGSNWLKMTPKAPKHLTIAWHFENKKKIVLKKPDWPCVIERGGGAHCSYYPIELMVVQPPKR